MSDTYRRARSVLLLTFCLAAGLVATHDGEFWPFSIYPMFSQAGQTWSRSLVRVLPADSRPAELWGEPGWRPLDFETLAGEPLALGEVGVNQNDLSNMVSKTRNWTPASLAALAQMLNRDEHQVLAIIEVRGSLSDEAQVERSYRPVIWLQAEQAFLNPRFSQWYP